MNEFEKQNKPEGRYIFPWEAAGETAKSHLYQPPYSRDPYHPDPYSD